MSLPFKVCPECGVEHVHAALVCADCNVALELATGDSGEPRPAAAFPPASELARVAAGGAWEMERLALLLQDAGISSRIDAPLAAAPSARPTQGAPARGAPRSGARLALYVLPAEAEPAQRVIADTLQREGFDPAAPAATGEGLEACPACAAPIAALASACADCGLEFVPVEDLCAACGAALAAEADACPACGARAPRERAD